MSRVATAEQAAAAFVTLAEAEGAAVPMYARLCRTIAATSAHRILLEAPTGQRLPVLLLAALHHTVLHDPSTPLARWYPTVTGTDPPDEDPAAALAATLADHGATIAEMVSTRTVQTNEVNRAVGWHLALRDLAGGSERPVTLVELGAAAGLNLALADHSVEVRTRDGTVHQLGRADGPVRLGTRVHDPDWQPTGNHLPTIEAAWGIDRDPVDLDDPTAVAWLRACVWPERRARFERLAAAIDRARVNPPTVHQGDLLDDLDPLLDELADGTHAVLLSSWVLAYLPRDDRNRLAQQLQDAAGRLDDRGVRLSLLTLEADHTLDWIPTAAREEHEPPDRRHASLLAVTEFSPTGLVAAPIARCQAHLDWYEPL